MAKVYALVILVVLSLLTPLLEVLVTGRIEPFGKFTVAETLLSIALIYWWYYVDKEQMKFHAGPIQNVGIIALAIIALPIYFIRSRGWKCGSISIAMAGGFLVVTYFLGLLGETIGTAFTS